MINKIKQIFKSSWMTVVIIGTTLLGVAIFIINAIFGQKQIDNQVKNNEKTLDNVKEEKAKDEKIVDNIDNNLSNSPFEQSRNKKSK